MKPNFLLTMSAVLAMSFSAVAQNPAAPREQARERESAAAQKSGAEKKPTVTVNPTGTVRTKVEYQPAGGENGVDNARFDVRTARFGIGGKVSGLLDYKMEIDLSDEGKMKMVDAYVGGKIWRGLRFNLGYMRVPFTVDAHRSPHLQMFANRSFIAKQAGNVRDVGATLGWSGFGLRVARKLPINIQLGMFNGSGLPTDLQQYWTRVFNYSVKAQIGVLPGVNLVGGYQTTKPGPARIHMYDAAVTWTDGRWLVEGEYLRKEYSGVFDWVNSVDAFVCYGLPMERGPFERISFLGRWDYLGDHSNGTAGAGGALAVNDPARHRATAGTTFSLGLPFMADIRLNYEKYFYRTGTTPGPSDHDKIVLELMVHF